MPKRFSCGYFLEDVVPNDTLVCVYLFALCSMEGDLCNHMGLPVLQKVGREAGR